MARSISAQSDDQQRQREEAEKEAKLANGGQVVAAGSAGVPGGGDYTTVSNGNTTATQLGDAARTSDASNPIRTGAVTGGGPVGAPNTAPKTNFNPNGTPAVPPFVPTSGDGSNDLADAQKLRDALFATAQNQTPGMAPQAGAPAPVDSATVLGTGAVRAATSAAPPTIAAPTIAQTNIGPAQTYNATEVGYTGPATAGLVGAAQVNADPQAQFRQQQQDLAAALQATVNGTGGPDAAELQGQRQADDAISSQLALAAGVHGYGALAAERAAARNVGTLQQKAAGDAAILRAQEQATARGQLNDVLGGARGQDLSLATKNADLTQGANTTNAQLTTQVSISNADRDAARQMKDADLRQSAAAGNAAAINELNERQAALTAQTLATNAANAIDVGKANASNTVQTNLTNTAEQNKVALANQDTDLKGKLAQAGFDEQSILSTSDADLKTKLANAGFSLTQEQIDAQKQQSADNLALQASQSLLNYHTGQQQLDLQRAQLAEQIKQASQQHDFQLLGTLLNVASTLGAAAIGA